MNKYNIEKYKSIIVKEFDLIIISLCIFLSMTNQFLTYNMRMPSWTQYCLDVFLFILFIRVISEIKNNLYCYKKQECNKIQKYYTILLLLFTVVVMISAVGNEREIVRLVKSFYIDYVRYMMFFMGALFLKISKQKMVKVIECVCIFIIIQFPIILIQTHTIEVYETSKYVIRDYYSGVLGYKATAELGFLIVMVVAYYYGKMLKKNIKPLHFISLVIYMMAMVIYIEVKLIVLVLPLVLLIISLFFVKDRKVLYLLGGIIIISFVAVTLVGVIYPHFSDVFKLEGILETAGYQYADSGMSRLTSIPKALESISQDPFTILFGKGPGSGIRYYNGVYQFRLFFFAYLIVEYGILGFTTLMGFFLTMLYLSIKKIITINKDELAIGTLGIATLTCMAISGVYSMSMCKPNFASIVWMVLGVLCLTERE